MIILESYFWTKGRSLLYICADTCLQAIISSGDTKLCIFLGFLKRALCRLSQLPVVAFLTAKIIDRLTILLFLG